MKIQHNDRPMPNSPLATMFALLEREDHPDHLQTEDEGLANLLGVDPREIRDLD